MRGLRTFGIVACFAALIGPAAGCYTNDAARARAVELSADLESYRQDQAKRLDDINRQYRFDFARLVAESTRLRLGQTEQAFDLDTMQAAGEVLSEWEAETLPRRIRDRFAASLERRRLQLLDVDKQIDEARAAYAESYREVALNLTRLKTAKSGIDALAVPEDRRKTFAAFVTTVGRIINEMREEADKEGAKEGVKDAKGGATEPDKGTTRLVKPVPTR